MPTRVEICGITSLATALAAVEAGADALGFVFAPGKGRIDPEHAREIILRLPPFVTKVGVFANEQRYVVEELGTFCKLDVLQFHGDEPPEYFRRWSYQTVKAFSLGPDWNPEILTKYEVDAFLLDSRVRGMQGSTDRAFDWSKVQDAKQYGKPVILTGGLTPENVTEAIKIVNPYAVEVSIGVEQSREQEQELINRFLAETRRRRD